ncbi:hypothetical protein FGO68_gene7621 [Halteria grandinella]|uniref:Uncharacterized protein n=1 Tax=Halteria grandinella TaxID=5974 RepID=A0A8J8NYQ2_HALGN|nr:hypothetical protein FGO68_gene7621 [Halteria grandinella]
MSGIIQGIGKIKSKYLIFEFFAHACTTRLDFTTLLFTSSTSTRCLLICNLPLLSRTHPIVACLAISSPFDIIVSANPLPKQVYLQCEFHMTQHYLEQLSIIEKHTSIMFKECKLKFGKDTDSESEDKLLQGIERYRPTQLTIKFINIACLNVSLIPPSVKSLVLIGNLREIKGKSIKPLKVRNLYASIFFNDFMLQNVGSTIIPSKKFTWHVSSKGPEITEEWLKQLPSSLQITLYIKELSPAYLFVNTYPNVTLKAQYCMQDNAEMFKASTNAKYDAIKFFICESTNIAQLSEFLQLPHPVKQIEFDNQDNFVNLDISPLNETETQELIFESARFSHVPLISGLVNNCRGVKKVRFSRMVQGERIKHLRGGRIARRADDPKKTFKDQKITWDRVMEEIEFKEHEGMNAEWDYYFGYLRNNTKKLIYEEKTFNSGSFSNSDTIEYIVKNFCYEGIKDYQQMEDNINLETFPNLKELTIKNYRKRFVHTFG